MYATRPLSMYRKSPGALSMPPAEGGHMVVTDEESEQQDAYCWGLYKNKKIKKLPFPQHRILKIVHLSRNEERAVTKAWFVPVLGRPLSSNCYHVIIAKGKYKGCAAVCSRGELITSRCFFSRDEVRDLKPRLFDHRDIYQQVEIRRYQNGGFYSTSVADDGFPPKFLRRKGWEVYAAHSFRLRLREAQGLRIPPQLDLNLPESNYQFSNNNNNNISSPPIIIGKWYCPFVFVKEKASPKEQMKSSLLYELRLEAWWEEICSFEKNETEEEEEEEENVVVKVNAGVQREVAVAYGSRAAVKDDDRRDVDGWVWFRVVDDDCEQGKERVGLSSAITEKMRGLQERQGWAKGGGGRESREVRVEREEESPRLWRRFGCYVLVQSYELRRMDGSVLLKLDFRHTHKVICQWF